MKPSVAPLLACPRRDGGAACRGALAVAAPPGLPVRYSERIADELLEGGLECARCGTRFPVLAGAAVLVPDPDEYLRRYQRPVLRDLDRHGCLSPEARSWVARRYGGGRSSDDYGADFRFSQQFEDPWSVAKAMAASPGELYGPFAEWLQAVSGHGPYDVLADWGIELAEERRLALDAGCGCGGLLGRVASRFVTGFGVDLSLLAVLLARRALLHRPEPERSYLLAIRRGQDVERPLTVPHAGNLEMFVGDCRALPFPAGLFDAVFSSNVIDIAGIEEPIEEAHRVMRDRGMLLLSDPFYFRDGEAPPGDPRAALHAVLEKQGLAVEVVRDAVPWAWATYDRHWRLYFNYCLAARKI